MGDGERASETQLIEGGIGPFYVALNRATFLLVAGTFAAIVPLAVYLVRDAPLPVALAVTGGIALESGAVAHIAVERVMRRPARVAWLAHVAVSVALASVLLPIMFA